MTKNLSAHFVSGDLWSFRAKLQNYYAADMHWCFGDTVMFSPGVALVRKLAERLDVPGIALKTSTLRFAYEVEHA